jgi:hypothetical protein
MGNRVAIEKEHMMMIKMIRVMAMMTTPLQIHLGRPRQIRPIHRPHLLRERVRERVRIYPVPRRESPVTMRKRKRKRGKTCMESLIRNAAQMTRITPSPLTKKRKN